MSRYFFTFPLNKRNKKIIGSAKCCGEREGAKGDARRRIGEKKTRKVFSCENVAK